MELWEVFLAPSSVFRPVPSPGRRPTAHIPPEEMSGKMGFQKTALKEGPMPKQRLLREHHTETIGRRFFIMLSLVAALGIVG